MNNLEPHVYFAECSGEYYLSVLTKLPAENILSRTPQFEVNGNVLNITFAVDSRNRNGGDWICRRAFSNTQINGCTSIKLMIDGGGFVELHRSPGGEEANDFMEHDEVDLRTLFKGYPHLYAEKIGNFVSASVCQKSSFDVEFDIDGTKTITSPVGQIQGYNIYSAEGIVTSENARISAEDQDPQARKKGKPRRKKSKVRHSY